MYLHYLQCIHDLKSDRVHKDAKVTLRLGFEEATEAACNSDKRKF